MKCAKVICVWMGDKRPLSNNCPTVDIIDESIDLEINLNKGYPTDTYFVVNKSGDSLDNYLDKYDNMETCDGVIKVMKRPNLGLSFAAYLETYYKFKNEYDYWFFCEDDVIIYKENYVKMFIENLKDDISFVALSPISNHIRKHCGGGCGLTSSHFMNDAYPYDEITTILEDWCTYEGYDGGTLETTFTSKFNLSNCKNVSALASNWNLHSSQKNHANNNLQSNYIYRVGKDFQFDKF